MLFPGFNAEVRLYVEGQVLYYLRQLSGMFSIQCLGRLERGGNMYGATALRSINLSQTRKGN